jgi:hypothetical protein
MPNAAFLTAVAFFLLSSLAVAAAPSGRFFIEGNGTVHSLVRTRVRAGR